MENNDLKEQNSLQNQESTSKRQYILNSPNETNLNENLTNEQKLEYLKKLIEEAEKNLESNGISKKLGR